METNKSRRQQISLKPPAIASVSADTAAANSNSNSKAHDHPSSRIIHQVGSFLDSGDLAVMIFVCRDWLVALQHNSYRLHYEAQNHHHSQALSSFLSFFRHASSIRFHQVNSSDDRAEELPALLEKFKTIELVDCAIAESFSQMPIPNLQSFLLHGAEISGDVIVEALKPWNHLKHLTLSQCIRLNEQHIHKIISACCPHLQTLTLSRTYLLGYVNLSTPMVISSTPSSVDEPSSIGSEHSVCRFRKLTITECPLLHLRNLLPASDPTNKSGNSSLTFPLLEYLNLSHTAATLPVITELLQKQQLRTPSLQTLVLNGCQQLGPHVTFQALPTIQTISLFQCTRMVELYISDCTALQYLHLSLCEHLQRIVLHNIPLLTSLSLVMLQELQELSLTHCPKLQQLDIMGCVGLGCTQTVFCPPSYQEKDSYVLERVRVFRQLFPSGKHQDQEQRELSLADISIETNDVQTQKQEITEDVGAEDLPTLSDSIVSFLCMLYANCPALALLPWIDEATAGTVFHKERDVIRARLQPLFIHK